MAVNPIIKGYTKTQLKNSAMINGVKSEKEKAKPATQKPEAKKPNTDSLKVQTNNQNPHGLSERALAYLETLKEKFGDMNFVVTRGEQHGGAAGGCPDKSYNCFIDADLLEKMAACEETAAKYEGVIKDAVVQVDDLKAQAEAKGLGHLVSNFGIKLEADGTWSFSAILRDSIWDKIGNKTDSSNKNILSSSKEGILGELERIREQIAEAKEAEKVEGEEIKDVDFKA
ncbi:MAG: DUF6033 family protein [Oscillospiraceae bacterium]|jgi:hypothetical protein|nr:DUF6033 family protein [Oscillospiraceae bacterium]